MGVHFTHGRGEGGGVSNNNQGNFHRSCINVNTHLHHFKIHQATTIYACCIRERKEILQYILKVNKTVPDGHYDCISKRGVILAGLLEIILFMVWVQWNYDIPN